MEEIKIGNVKLQVHESSELGKDDMSYQKACERLLPRIEITNKYVERYDKLFWKVTKYGNRKINNLFVTATFSLVTSVEDIEFDNCVLDGSIWIFGEGKLLIKDLLKTNSDSLTIRKDE